MSDFLILIGFLAMLAGLISLVKPLKFLRIENRKIAALVLIGGFIIVGIGGSLDDSVIPTASSSSVDEALAEAKPVSYDELARYPNQYEGKGVILRGEIKQKISNTEFRVAITQNSYGWWEDTIYVKLKGDARDARILEDDIIDFTGIGQGEITYKAVLGQKITIPSVAVYMIDVAVNSESN